MIRDESPGSFFCAARELLNDVSNIAFAAGMRSRWNSCQRFPGVSYPSTGESVRRNPDGHMPFKTQPLAFLWFAN